MERLKDIVNIIDEKVMSVLDPIKKEGCKFSRMEQNNARKNNSLY